MSKGVDVLVNRLVEDFRHQDFAATVKDAGAILSRDNVFSNPKACVNQIAQDVKTLLSEGIPAERLKQLGFPAATLDLKPGEDGAVIRGSDGSAMPVELKDVVKDLTNINDKAEAIANRIHSKADLGSPKEKDELRKLFVEARKSGQELILEERINFYLGEKGDERRIWYGLNHEDERYFGAGDPMIILRHGTHHIDGIYK
jgi:hypothetical protein